MRSAIVVVMVSGSCFCTGVTQHLQAAEVTSVEGIFGADSNPAKAQFDRDIESATSVRAIVNGSLWQKELTEDSGLSVDARATFEINSIEELGESIYRIGGEWFREDKEATATPLYTARAELSLIDSETDIRDSVNLGLAGSVNWQFAPFLDATAGARVDVRVADSEAFDTSRLQIFGIGNFSPLNRLVLRAGLRAVLGNEVSSATPTLSIVRTAEVIEPDDAFGGFDERRFAYLLDANSVLLELGATYEVSPVLSVDAGYRYVFTQADDGIDYRRNLLEFSVRYAIQ